MKKEIEDMIHEKYLVGKFLGRGTTGDVYEVFGKESNRKYAMKMSKEKSIVRQEAEMMKELPCKMFPAIYDYREAKYGYLIMECVEGQNLQEILDKGVTFELREAVWIVLSVLEGLAFLHKQTPSYVYRDLKPANILIEASGEIRLIYFGGVVCSEKKETDGVVRAGTYGYAAPEQFWPNMVPQPNWDIYAAGKLLGYLLSGHNPALPPYEVEEYFKKDKKIPGAIKEVLNRCLASQGQARYEDAEQMRKHLKMALEETKNKKWKFPRKMQEFEYKKCIWLSEYRRIF